MHCKRLSIEYVMYVYGLCLFYLILRPKICIQRLFFTIQSTGDLMILLISSPVTYDSECLYARKQGFYYKSLHSHVDHCYICCFELFFSTFTNPSQQTESVHLHLTWSDSDIFVVSWNIVSPTDFTNRFRPPPLSAAVSLALGS